MLKTLKTLIAVIMLLSVVIPACAADTATSENIQRVKAKELKSLLDKGEMIMIVDVRSPDEFDEMHIAGAISVPLHLVEAKFAGLSPDTKIVFY